MHTSIGIASLAVLLCSPIPARSQSGPNPSRVHIIPSPQQAQARDGVFKIAASTRIVLGEGSTRDDLFAAQRLNEELGRLRNRQLKILDESSVRRLQGNTIFIGPPNGPHARSLIKARRYSLRNEMKNEGYVLDVGNDGIVILAESSAGRYYAVVSLLQMLEREKKSIVVPACTIVDWPAQGTRGITDDLSRGQVSTLENFKEIIRRISRYKLNVYSPYIEDIFTFKNHPLIGKGRGALTPKEVKELDATAKQYHVEMIPIFETLGHWENILAIAEYAKYAEFPGAHTVNVSDEAVYALLDEMIGELSRAFSSPWFNMAADESWDVGLGASRERVARTDIATVHAEHYNRVFDIIRKHGKRPMMYGDIILNNPTILDKIPKDVVIIDWQYGVADRYASPEVFRKAGFPFIVSPAVWNFTGPFPNYINTFVNVRNFNRDGFVNGSQGVLTSNWNDNGGEALRELNTYGYAWTAESAWHPLAVDETRFNRMFFSDFFGTPAATEMQTVYALLSDPLNQMSWQDLWRHPMLPLRQSLIPPLWRIQSIRSTMPLVQTILERLRSSATKNQSHIDLLMFVSKLNLWFAGKLEAGEHIRKLTQELPPSSNKDSVRAVVAELAEPLVDELLSLKEEFKRLWLTTNVEANLEWIMKRYDRQAQFWNEKLRQVSRGELWVDPLIESQWIYHPLANPRVRDTSARQVPKAYFRRTFQVPDSVFQGTLQLMGDTHVKLWLNGAEVGEVVARPSLSLSLEYQRVKSWEIGKYLKKGANIVAAASENFDTFGSAGLNVYGELKVKGDSTWKLLTDAGWKVTDKVDAGWQGATYSDSTWLQAKPVAFPSPVTRPDFVSGRLSWIER